MTNKRNRKIQKYTLNDKIKAFSLRHRKLVVLLLTISCLLLIGIGVSYSYLKNKPTQEEFDEIQVLIDKIEKHDANIINTLEVEELSKTTKGIDVSGWQGNINWEKVKKSNNFFYNNYHCAFFVIFFNFGFKNHSKSILLI